MCKFSMRTRWHVHQDLGHNILVFLSFRIRSSYKLRYWYSINACTPDWQNSLSLLKVFFSNFSRILSFSDNNYLLKKKKEDSKTVQYCKGNCICKQINNLPVVRVTRVPIAKIVIYLHPQLQNSRLLNCFKAKLYGLKVSIKFIFKDL